MIPTKLVVGTTLATEAPKRCSRRGIPNYPLEFRRQLAKLACEPGVSVARLAMEHGLNPNLVFKWHRALRVGDAFASDDVAVGILPITGRPSLFPCSYTRNANNVPCGSPALGGNVTGLPCST